MDGLNDLKSCLIPDISEIVAKNIADDDYANYEEIHETLNVSIEDEESYLQLMRKCFKFVHANEELDWKEMADEAVNPQRLVATLWWNIERANAKSSSATVTETAAIAASLYIVLCRLKGAKAYHVFHSNIYEKAIGYFRLIFRLRCFGARNATAPPKGKGRGGGRGGRGKGRGGGRGAASNVSANATISRDQDEEAEDVPNSHDLDLMLRSATLALFIFLRKIPLSTQPVLVANTVDMLRELCRLVDWAGGEGKTTQVGQADSLQQFKGMDLIERIFALMHVLAESKHGLGGEMVHARFVMPRLACWTWTNETLATSIPAWMGTLRKLAVTFVRLRVEAGVKAELATISRLILHIMSHSAERSEYRVHTARSVSEALEVISHKKKMLQALLQEIYSLCLTPNTTMRGVTVELVPLILQRYDLAAVATEADAEDDDAEGEDGDTTVNRTSRGKKSKLEQKNRKNRSGEGSDDEEDEEVEEEQEEDENEDGNTTANRTTRGKKGKQGQKNKKKKKKSDEGSDEEEEDEEAGEDSKDEDEEEAAKNSKKKKKTKKGKAAAPLPQVNLQNGFYFLAIRSCMDRAVNVRSKAIGHMVDLVLVEKHRQKLVDAADKALLEYPKMFTGGDENEPAEEAVGEEEKEEVQSNRRGDDTTIHVDNVILHIILSRMDDEKAVVRKSATAAIKRYFPFIEKDCEAEDAITSLKTRCLDEQKSVRDEAIEVLSFLLSASLKSASFRERLEGAWLKSVLPLINDRENTVQKNASNLIEQHLVRPVMDANTPPECWRMLKRVEQEDNNRRLLLRTLHFISRETALNDKLVNTLCRKLGQYPGDESTSIWMLLSDLSTVVKVAPSIAIDKWRSIEEGETDNSVRYVAKVLGQGAKEVSLVQKEDVIADMQMKLLEFKIAAPHIATVYLALAKLMDAVGEEAKGGKSLERFGRHLLDECAKIIKLELESDHDDLDAAIQIQERRLIRVVSTIGEVIQLSPGLIDGSAKLLDALKIIMASDQIQSNMKVVNSAVPSVVQSRVQSRLSTQHPPDSQSTQQTLPYSQPSQATSSQAPSSQATSSQPMSMGTIIPDHVVQALKNGSLSEALFTRAVRAYAVVAIGKFCLMDEMEAKNCVPVFVRQLKINPDHVIRNNIVIVICDLCIRYTLLVDRYSPIIASCLKDSSNLVRLQTLESITNLIKEQFIRWEGQIMYRFVGTILDEDSRIKEYAEFCLNSVLLPLMPHMFTAHFIECLMYFNDVPKQYCSADEKEVMDGSIKFSMSGDENIGTRMKLYKFMLSTFDDKQKFMLMAKISNEIFPKIVGGDMPINDEKIIALLKDSLQIMACDEMKLRMQPGKKEGDEDEEEVPQHMQDAAKSVITDAFRKGIIENIMPNILELRTFLFQTRSKLLRECVVMLSSMIKDHKDFIREFLGHDASLIAQVEMEIKQINEKEAKLKAKQKAKAEAQKIRRKSIRKSLAAAAAGQSTESVAEGATKAVESEPILVEANPLGDLDGMDMDEGGGGWDAMDAEEGGAPASGQGEAQRHQRHSTPIGETEQPEDVSSNGKRRSKKQRVSTSEEKGEEEEEAAAAATVEAQPQQTASTETSDGSAGRKRRSEKRVAAPDASAEDEEGEESAEEDAVPMELELETPAEPSVEPSGRKKKERVGENVEREDGEGEESAEEDAVPMELELETPAEPLVEPSGRKKKEPVGENVEREGEAAETVQPEQMEVEQPEEPAPQEKSSGRKKRSKNGDAETEKVAAAETVTEKEPPSAEVEQTAKPPQGESSSRASSTASGVSSNEEGGRRRSARLSGGGSKDTEKENIDFAAPALPVARKRTRATSEASSVLGDPNETVVGGLAVSTPKSGAEGARPDFDMSAISFPTTPTKIPGRGKVSRRPNSSTIQED